MSETIPPYFVTPLDRALFGGAETLIQPPSGVPLPPLAAGRFRYVLAANGLFVQARTACLDASVRLAPLPDGLPYGAARAGARRVHGPVPEDLWRELKRRAVAACPLEWSAYVLHDGRDYRLHEPVVYGRDAGHIRYAPLPESHRDALALHVHSHGNGDAGFSAQDDRADREAGDGVYVAGVLGRCRAVATITEAWRLVVWRWWFGLEGAPQASLSALPLMGC